MCIVITVIAHLQLVLLRKRIGVTTPSLNKPGLCVEVLKELLERSGKKEQKNIHAVKIPFSKTLLDTYCI